MPVSRVGKRRQVVIPKAVCEEVGLKEGDFVEVKYSRGAIVLTAKKLVDRDDVLTPEEEKIVLRGEHQLRRGDSLTLEQLEDELDSQSRKRSRKTA
jgi:AbrB family looped-hinge helix DNA binding protein